MKRFSGIITAILLLSSSLFAAPAAVAVNPTSLSFGSVIQGDTSHEESYQLVGNKNSIINVIASAGFLVSLSSDGPYTSTLAVVPNGGVVNATIYVVFAPTGIQSYSDTIGNVMQTHLVNANVAVSGTGIGVENNTSFTATPGILSTAIDLEWTKNTNNDDCMIARTIDGVFGHPVNGATYSVNDTISGGGTVMYKGIDLLFADTGLTPSTLYYYKIFSISAAGGVDPVYSTGLEASATTTPEPAMLGLIAGAALLILRKK